MTPQTVEIDILCVGHACYDLVFSVEQHPQADEKIFATDLNSSGGGPAANAAITVSRLGLKAGFAGYLGNDLYGEMHHQELQNHQVNTQLLVRDKFPTPLSTVLVKPDGKRALINYKGSTRHLQAGAINFSALKAKAILLDGHEPQVSLDLIKLAKQRGIPTILDAGSLHEGTSSLLKKVDYLVASEKFAYQFAGNIEEALVLIAEVSPAVVITLGEKGIIWQRGQRSGSMAAYPVKVIDTTGAGDAFHGAFAVAIAKKMSWHETLSYASAAGSLCCTKIGARQGLPWQHELNELIRTEQVTSSLLIN